MPDNRLPIWLGDTYEFIGLRDGKKPRATDGPNTQYNPLLKVVGISVTGNLSLDCFDPEDSGRFQLSIDITTAKELIHDGIWRQVFNDASTGSAE